METGSSLCLQICGKDENGIHSYFYSHTSQTVNKTLHIFGMSSYK